MLELKKGGHLNVVQDRESSVVFGMPKAAIDYHAADLMLQKSSLREFILNTTKEE